MGARRRISFLDTAAQITALLDAAGKIRGALRDELLSVRAAIAGANATPGSQLPDGVGAQRGGAVANAPTGAPLDPDAYVFPTRSVGRRWEDHVRSRTLRPAVKSANAKVARAGLPPLPERLTPHALRRTFASVSYALGESPPVVMAEMGHTSPALALRVYAQTMRRDEDEKAALRALVDGVQLAVIGRRGAVAPIIGGELTAR